ncbi:hypothetical protein [Zhongshania sp. BJYM1]|uniref:hypothetical protein n=1 Tax=Zhongshania aquatica TaxID=2965069 RepID=UPI0022B4118A|nr:hypothetical protein [Marortus sp. BJYM1]
MPIKIDKLEIADQMLESAIEEFLDKKRFFTAFNSAGVASEIYAKAIRLKGSTESQREVIDAAMALMQKWNVPDSSLREMKKIANRLKNGIKHFDSENDRYIELAPEEEAMYMIAEAMTNSEKLYRAQTHFHPKVYRVRTS